MLRDFSGIYRVENLVTGKSYIGSAVNLRKRKNSHFSKLKSNIHHSIKLQRAYNKYGLFAFRFVILETCKPEELIEREQIYIDKYLPHIVGYNVDINAHSSLGVKRSDAFKEKLRQANLGKKHSSITKLKKNLYMKANPIGFIVAIPINQYKNSKLVKRYDTKIDAATANNISLYYLTKACKGELKTYLGYTWEYAVSRLTTKGRLVHYAENKS